MIMLTAAALARLLEDLDFPADKKRTTMIGSHSSGSNKIR
jgi:hypothetical protein